MTDEKPTETAETASLTGERSEPSQLAKLAHELKTPLSAIAAAAEIMRDERLGPLGSERYRGYAADIFSSARHALGVINQMLETARADGAPIGLSFAEIDLNQLAEGVLSFMQPLAEEAKISLTSGLAARLPHVVADPTSVRQMLLNLLTNAIKFTGSGGRVHVTTNYELDGPVTIEVRDDGPGVEAEASPRGPAAEEGLGIGLPLVRSMAEANGAVVVIESRPGEGTAVRIVFRKDHVVPV